MNRWRLDSRLGVIPPMAIRPKIRPLVSSGIMNTLEEKHTKEI